MLCGLTGYVERKRARAMRLELCRPKYWATWVGLGVLRLIETLPFAAQLRVGSALGRLIRRLPLAYVRIARRNIQLCLPALSPQPGRMRESAAAPARPPRLLMASRRRMVMGPTIARVP